MPEQYLAGPQHTSGSTDLENVDNKFLNAHECVKQMHCIV